MEVSEHQNSVNVYGIDEDERMVRWPSGLSLAV
jgi:hypothetical protein